MAVATPRRQRRGPNRWPLPPSLCPEYLSPAGGDCGDEGCRGSQGEAGGGCGAGEPAAGRAAGTGGCKGGGPRHSKLSGRSEQPLKGARLASAGGLAIGSSWLGSSLAALAGGRAALPAWNREAPHQRAQQFLARCGGQGAPLALRARRRCKKRMCCVSRWRARSGTAPCWPPPKRGWRLRRSRRGQLPGSWRSRSSGWGG